MKTKEQTDRELYHMRLRSQNVIHRHQGALIDRERHLKAIKATHAYRDAAIQHATLLEATRRLPPALQRYYHDKMRTLASRMDSIQSKYDVEPFLTTKVK